jgi:hypothetical protein
MRVGSSTRIHAHISSLDGVTYFNDDRALSKTVVTGGKGMTSPESPEDKALVEIQAVSQQASNVSSRLSSASQVQTM